MSLDDLSDTLTPDEGMPALAPDEETGYAMLAAYNAGKVQPEWIEWEGQRMLAVTRLPE